MKEIKEAQRQWQIAKDEAQRLKEESLEFAYARKLCECKMFTGEESLEDMIKMMFSARGAEFLTTFGFPNIETFRKFKKYNPERFGVFIDKGEITLTDNHRVFLVGDTSATLNYTQTAANRLILMHGAKATVIASGFSVVNIEKDKTSNVSLIIQDKAKVL